MQTRLSALGALALLAAMAAASAVSAQEVYVEEAMFTIPWGDGPGEVGLSPYAGETGERAGPCHLQLDRHGNIWLLDGHNLAVKCFSPEGDLLRSVGRVEADAREQRWGEWNWLAMIGGIRGYAADGRGFACLLADTFHQHMLVIDPSGEAVTSRADCYWRLMERRGEEKVLWQLEHETTVDWIGNLDVLAYRRLATDDQDRLYLLGKAEEQEPGAGTETEWYVFSPDLQYLGKRPGYYCGPDGYTYQFHSQNTPEDVRLHAWDREGDLVGTRRLAHPEGSWPPCAMPCFDRQQNIYLPCPVEREQSDEVRLPAEVSETPLTIERDYVLYKFSPAGELLASVTVPHIRFVGDDLGSPVAVDADQDIYYLLPAEDGTHVMRLRLAEDAEGE